MGGFLVDLVIKNQLANTEVIRDMGSILVWEYPLEKGMATLSSILAWRIPWTGEPDGIRSLVLERAGQG